MNSKSRVFIIAEAGVNHNGSLQMAKKLIDRAAEAGADAVKFQTFNTDRVVTKRAPKAAYQKKTSRKKESQWEMIKKLELSPSQHEILQAHAKKRKIEFMSSPFDIESVDLLVNRLKIRRIKIPSGEITNAPLLLHIARANRPVILSTGMTHLDEVREALGVLAAGYLGDRSPSVRNFRRFFGSHAGQAVLEQNVSILHCTTEYPTPLKDVNLRAMDTLRDTFQLPVGLSDHTEGITVAIAAVARGAEIIEKHFTLDRKLAGPDHRASLEPKALKQMITAIREVEAALGDAIKRPALSELKNKKIARKSLVAATAIKVGDIFTDENLTSKRPGTGRSPFGYWELIGTKAKRKYGKDDLIK